MREVLDSLARAVTTALAADAAAIWLLDDAKASLSFAGAYGLPAEYVPRDYSPPDEHAPHREALANGFFLLTGLAADCVSVGLPTECRAALLLRLGVSERPDGVLHVYSFHPRTFSSSDLATTRVLADLGAIAIESARRAADLERIEAGQAQFIHITTHELRSPIAVSQTLVRNVLKGYAGPMTDKQQFIFSRISAQLDSLENLANDLLDLAASKAPGSGGAEEPVTLNASIGRVVLLLQPRAEEKGVELSYRACRDELVVWATEESLDRILVNLVGNAVKYTPPGGRVTVGICGTDGEVSATVSDTGIGIPPEGLAHLFEEFYRAPNARSAKIAGTGLGLAIVKKLVERYHGKIEVESTVGEGTTFTVVFPAYRSTT